ncbi:MAG: hypothetical protein ABIA91_01660 [Patescibacteria group bacterium]
MKNIIILFLIFLIGGFASYLVFGLNYTPFEKFSEQEMYQKIVENRDLAISKAVVAGKYHCCINPPCTMCYMEANQWNNYTAGTCACDDLIAEGKEACPQCRRGLDEIHSEDGTSCDINSQIATCDSIEK